MDATLVLVVLGAAAAGFVQGVSGFAYGLVAMAFWAWVLPPQLAAPMVVFGSLVGQLMAVGVVRSGFDARRVSPFVAGGLLGVPLGVWLLQYLDPDLFRLGLGTLLSIYCPVLLLARELPVLTRPGRLADAGVGLTGGVLGGIGGFTGPPLTLWCAMRPWGNNERRAVFQTFNLAMHAVTFGAYAVAGLITPEAGWMCGLVAVSMVLPNLIGTRLYGRIGDTGFRRLILLLLTGSGLTLVAAALPRVLT